MDKNKKIIHVNACNAYVQPVEINKFIESAQNQEKKLPFSISHVVGSAGLLFVLSINKDAIKADLNDSRVQNFMSYDNLNVNLGSISQLFYFDKDANPTPTDIMFDRKCERSAEDNFLTDDFLKKNQGDFEFVDVDFCNTANFSGYTENLKFLQSKSRDKKVSDITKKIDEVMDRMNNKIESLQEDANQFTSNTKPSSCFNLSSITEFFKKVIKFISCGMLCKDASKNK